MAVTIRHARPGDGDAIARAWLDTAAYYADLDAAYVPSPSADELAELWDTEVADGRDDALQLVAELGNRIIGWLLARILRPDGETAARDTAAHSPTLLMVDILVIERGHWRQGTGTALVGAAESWGAALGAQVARLATDARSPVSVPFYEQRMGYYRHTLIFQKRLRPSDP